ncbi:MAG: VIT domain-containing protein [Myxococcota bacterium]
MLRLLVGLVLILACVGCQGKGAPRVSPSVTFAELRTIKGTPRVRSPGEAPRPPYPRERLVDGEQVTLDKGALAWMRRDGGATWLIAGAADFTLRANQVELTQGRAFIDNELGGPVQVVTPRGKLELSEARSSIDVSREGGVSVYVLRGSVRAAGHERVSAGELLTWEVNGTLRREASRAWDDWTGGLATADAAAEPAPFGIGTVGARKAGQQGQPRFPLVIQRLDVKVTVDRDFALTEVDQTFVNPSSTEVEGLFSFRTPPSAVLSRFGVDRNGRIVWGRIQEARAAVKQYESNVYAGSQEEPALLQWAGSGVYNARLYPIRAGETRRVITRYGEWLSRQGPHGERRLYVYPMAAEGARTSLPRIEEMRFTLDLSQAGALRVRAGMNGKREGDRVVVKAFDFVPRADLSVELFDNGQATAVAYRAPHRLQREDVPEGTETGFASAVASEEADYLALPLRAAGNVVQAATGVDVAIVVDTSAATEPSALALARNMAGSLLAQLGPEDRAALWAGDASLRAVANGSDALAPVDAVKRREFLAGLAAIERGGATDLGALLSEAASKLDPKRRSAVIYIGDGLPSVGELAPKSLQERLARLGPGVRVLAAGIGTQPNVALLQRLVRGAPVERVTDAYGAAQAALRLLEAASKPLWLGARVDFGPGIERVLPRELPPISADESVLLVGRIRGNSPKSITLRSESGTVTRPIVVQQLSDFGDLRRRWGEGRLNELIAEGAGRASLVELARRFGLVSPFTSLYVPTEREQHNPELASSTQAAPSDAKRKRWQPWSRGGESSASLFSLAARSKEGGLGVAAAPAPAASAAAGNMFAKGERAVLDAPEEAKPEAAASPPPTVAKEAAGIVQPLEETEMATLSGLQATSPAGPPPSRPTSARAGASLRPASGGGGIGLSGRGRLAGMDPLADTGEEATLARGARKARAEKPAAPPSQPPPQSLKESRPKPAASTLVQVSTTQLAVVHHEPRPCGPGADLPLSERRILWRERLADASTATLALSVYRRALSECEATRWDERALLLVAIVDRLPTIIDRVELWRALLRISPAAADAVYRFMMLRVQTAADLKAVHDALGLERIDPVILAEILKRARTPVERLTLLRGAAERFRDDTELALLVLDAYEDAHDDAGGRAWARGLRRRVDATAHVRTQVGEFYLRLATRTNGAPAQRDLEEARRTFGELVEFAPEDPLARRRLGDLLRAHGWFEEASRQYETLSELTPDDPSVHLLRALAANGMGRVEEAVRWAEKAASTGAEDGSSPLSTAARAQAATFLAWARRDALAAGRKDEAERLRARADRLAARDSSKLRVTLSWAHPELRPALWIGSPLLPAPDNLPLYGVAQAFAAPEPTPEIELRLDPEDAASAARLDAKAIVTALIAEGEPSERILRLEVGFRDPEGKPLERLGVRLENGELVASPRANGGAR